MKPNILLIGLLILSLSGIVYATRYTSSPPEHRGSIFVSSKGASSPADTNCDSTNEEGGIYLDTNENRLYICFPSGWRGIDTFAG